MNRHIIPFVAFVALVTFSVAPVFAATPGGAVITDEVDLGRFPSQPPGEVNVTAGNITVVNLEVQQTTFRWVGLLGNVTGSIALGDSDTNTMYEWAARGNLVYAASSPTIDWPNLENANETHVLSISPWLGGVNDAYNSTFTGASESIGSDIFTLSSEYAVTNSAGATVWKTYSLWDLSTLIWVGQVVENGTSYRDTEVDYQMIIPEDGTGGSSTPTTYYLWVENI